MSAPPTSRLAGDAQSLTALRAKAAADPKAAVREAAKQFEALFMQELMKSMRAATLSSGMLENEGSKLGTEMLDQQLATQLTGMPGGLSDAITRQLERQMGVLSTGSTAAAASVNPLAAARAAGLPVPCHNPFQSILVRMVELILAFDEAIRIIEGYTPPPAAAPWTSSTWSVTSSSDARERRLRLIRSQFVLT